MHLSQPPHPPFSPPPTLTHRPKKFSEAARISLRVEANAGAGLSAQASAGGRRRRPAPIFATAQVARGRGTDFPRSPCTAEAKVRSDRNNNGARHARVQTLMKQDNNGLFSKRTHAHTYTCVRLSVFVCIRVCVCASVCECKCKCMCARTYTHAHTPIRVCTIGVLPLAPRPSRAEEESRPARGAGAAGSHSTAQENKHWVNQDLKTLSCKTNSSLEWGESDK